MKKRLNSFIIKESVQNRERHCTEKSFYILSWEGAFFHLSTKKISIFSLMHKSLLDYLAHLHCAIFTTRFCHHCNGSIVTATFQRNGVHTSNSRKAVILSRFSALSEIGKDNVHRGYLIFCSGCSGYFRLQFIMYICVYMFIDI